MTKIRKPIPKTQKEISVSQHEVYDKTTSNPNARLNPNENETGISFNRSEKLSFKGDKVKPFKIGLQDLDEAVFYYFEKVIQPFVLQNGERIKVPIIYSDPERWKSFRKDGYYRDKQGAVMLPIIIIKRDNLQKDRGLAHKIDANFPQIYGSFQKSFNSRNFYSNFATLNNRVPEKEFHAIVVPNYITLNYSCVIQTYYMNQLNKIIESIEYASDSYWGDPERFKFRAFIDGFATTTEINKGEDRIIKGTFEIRLKGHIISDVIQNDLNSLKKWNSKSKIIIQMETTSNSDIYEPNVTKLKDGRTRKKRQVSSRIDNIGDVLPGREVQDTEPGTDLRE